MTPLDDLPNIGPKLASDLGAVGILSAEMLRDVGADEAMELLARDRLRHCAHTYRAILGALEGHRWTTRA